MNAIESSSPSSVGRRRMFWNRYGVLLLGLTVVVCLATTFFVRPRIGMWLEMRSAYQDLSSLDSDARTYAARKLRRLGIEPESQLIELLHHSDSGVRAFAATELAHWAELTDTIIEVFLTELEGEQPAAEMITAVPRLIFRHAENATGPLTETDRRMIAWLTSELDSTDSERSGSAAWALTAFLDRNPTLEEPLAEYLKSGTFFYKYIVLREMVDRDSSKRDQYVDVLFSGLASSEFSDQANAVYGLTHLKDRPDNLRTRLEARREEATDPDEISRIDEALEEIYEDNAEAR